MLRSVQYARGMAAMMVVVYHILINTVGTQAGNADHHVFIFSGGVDLFFVISGFVMFYSTADRHVSPGAFMKARIVRLVPLYWLATLFALGYAALSRGYVPPMREIALSFGFIPYVNEFGNKWPILNPGWTLNYEMLFYTCFALTLFMRDWKWRAASITGIFASLIVMKPVLAPLGAMGAEFASGLITEFLMGICVGIAYRQGYIRCPKLLILAGVALAVVLMESKGFKGPRMLYAGLPAALILAGLLQMEHKVWNIPLLGLIGDASYSLYLSHPFVIDLVERFAPLHESAWNGAVAFVLCIAYGAAVYFLIEKPMLKWMRGFTFRRTRVGGAVLAGET